MWYCFCVTAELNPIVDAVLTMISRPDKMEEMGKKGRLISKDYTLENWKDRIKTLLNDSAFKKLNDGYKENINQYFI